MRLLDLGAQIQDNANICQRESKLSIGSLSISNPLPRLILQLYLWPERAFHAQVGLDWSGVGSFCMVFQGVHEIAACLLYLGRMISRVLWRRPGYHQYNIKHTPRKHAHTEATKNTHVHRACYI